MGKARLISSEMQGDDDETVRKASSIFGMLEVRLFRKSICQDGSWARKGPVAS